MKFNEKFSGSVSSFSDARLFAYAALAIMFSAEATCGDAQIRNREP